MPLNASPCFFTPRAPSVHDRRAHLYRRPFPADRRPPKSCPKNVMDLKKVRPDESDGFLRAIRQRQRSDDLGIPLPEVYGANLRVNHAKSGKPSGKATHANHGYLPASKHSIQSQIRQTRKQQSRQATSAEPTSKKQEKPYFFRQAFVLADFRRERAAQVQEIS